MEWYLYTAVVFVTVQVLYWLACYRNYRFVVAKGSKVRRAVGRTTLIIPCKGLDEDFDRNISSFFVQDHGDYVLWLVVQEESDPAFRRLMELKEKMAGRTTAKEVKILVAGLTRGCSQKLHNLLYACRQAGDETLMLAFADSDICVRPGWLGHLVHPLRKKGKYGASSGYRLFVPANVNAATVALSSMNGRVAQMLGPSGFNHVWGGSMAVRRDVFSELKIEEVWSKSISDDLALSRAVKKAGLKVAFVPACLVASYATFTWRKLFEFGRRQFVITRVTTPGLWTVGLFCSIYSVLGLWGGMAAAVYALSCRLEPLWPYVAVPAVFFVGHFWKAWLRQKTMQLVLDDRSRGLRSAARADMFLSWLWSPLLLGIIISSAFGRTITWRGIRYRLLGPDKVVVLPER
jgi:ceramide glucosyltransferase